MMLSPLLPRCLFLAIVTWLTVCQIAQADIITTLTGRVGLMPVALDIETVHAAVSR